MLIFSTHITNKLKYILDFIFKEQLGIYYSIVENMEEFKNENGPKFNYSCNYFNDCININPSDILWEEFISVKEIESISHNGILCPFKTDNGDFPFDIFGAIFYLITRYEEYLPHQQDEYNRYKAINSLAYKNNFLHLPVVDIWIQDLKEALFNKFPTLTFYEKKFTAQMTYDIDTAYAFKARSVGITLGNIVKDYWAGNLDLIKKRFNTIFNNKEDLYDTYNYIISANDDLPTPIFFFLVGDRSAYNKNIFFQSSTFMHLVDKIKKANYTIGLHPSYESPRNSLMMQTEKERLEYITKTTIKDSRQHYLRFYFPTTFNKLIELGIENEYSMCYPEIPGFRASTCSSFYFYDLVNDMRTNLKLYPITFMEGTFAEDLALTPQEALPKMLECINEVKKVNGYFNCIWHNHTLSNYGKWYGWKMVHQTIIDKLKENIELSSK